jgi:hypothetical protein
MLTLQFEYNQSSITINDTVQMCAKKLCEIKSPEIGSTRTVVSNMCRGQTELKTLRWELVDMFGKPICFGTWVSYNNAVFCTCVYSFQTYQKVMVMKCCLDWMLYVWQSLEKGEYIEEIWKWEVWHYTLPSCLTVYKLEYCSDSYPSLCISVIKQKRILIE